MDKDNFSFDITANFNELLENSDNHEEYERSRKFRTKQRTDDEENNFYQAQLAEEDDRKLKGRMSGAFNSEFEDHNVKESSALNQIRTKQNSSLTYSLDEDAIENRVPISEVVKLKHRGNLNSFDNTGQLRIKSRTQAKTSKLKNKSIEYEETELSELIFSRDMAKKNLAKKRKGYTLFGSRDDAENVVSSKLNLRRKSSLANLKDSSIRRKRNSLSSNKNKLKAITTKSLNPIKQGRNVVGATMNFSLGDSEEQNELLNEIRMQERNIRQATGVVRKTVTLTVMMVKGLITAFKLIMLGIKLMIMTPMISIPIIAILGVGILAATTTSSTAGAFVAEPFMVTGTLADKEFESNRPSLDQLYSKSPTIRVFNELAKFHRKSMTYQKVNESDVIKMPAKTEIPYGEDYALIIQKMLANGYSEEKAKSEILDIYARCVRLTANVTTKKEKVVDPNNFGKAKEEDVNTVTLSIEKLADPVDKINDPKVKKAVQDYRNSNNYATFKKGYERLVGKTRGMIRIKRGKGQKSSGQYEWPSNVSHVITSTFGPRDMFGRSFHYGIDIAAGGGTDVLAADSGTVEMAEWFGGYGNYVRIRHDNGECTAYGHMETILVDVGDHVNQGDTIGLCGSTGDSTGNHIHFEIIVNGTKVDPLPYLPED